MKRKMNSWRLVAVALACAAVCEAATVTIDPSTRYQTIEGFGAHGAMQPWFASGPYYDAAFIDRVIGDLGLTMNRELYGDINSAEFNFSSFRPYLAALKAKADATGEPLRFIVSVLSPAAQFKSNNSFTGGGTLLAQYYDDFANRLVTYLNQWTAAGLEVYGVSLQNEPAFAEPYGSCVYTAAEYRDMVKVAGPVIHAAHPNVKLFGTENMLANWGALEGPLMADTAARRQMSSLSVHGYSDGIHPDPGSASAASWSRARKNCEPSGKTLWMSETSGYNDTWGAGGAQEVAAAIFAALKYGHVSAWVWWQLSEAGESVYALMNSGTPGKRYYVAKQYYRYIRPGAVMIGCGSDDPDVLAVAFRHDTQQTLALVLLNTATSARQVALIGDGAASYAVYRTSAGENCVSVGTVQAGSMALPASSVTTLYATGFRTPVDPGVGSSGRAAGAVPRPASACRVFGLDGRRVPAGAAAVSMGAYVVSRRDRSGSRVAMALVRR